MTSRTSYGLFEVYGVELEYMIVDADALAVRPIADEVLKAVAGTYQSEVEIGPLSWSNELALHVIELKTTEPAAALVPLAEMFQSHVGRINEILAPLGARLMPTAMHPWMEPLAELKLWPHEYSPVYEAYHRIFDCRGHGWANLQSVHLNLPFADDDEFGRLHAAIRLALPLLPALAASSPIADGRLTGLLDTRLDVYRTNALRVPSVTGQVVPEPVYTERDYQRLILEPMYADIAPLDPAGTLQHEWLNSRGAIARFDRRTIEIRVIDMQECPVADVAVCAATAAVLKALAAERWSDIAAQQSYPTEPLAALLLATTRDADRAEVSDPAYRRLFGLSTDETCTAGQLWRHVIDELGLLETRAEGRASWQLPLRTILKQGPLARRIASAVGSNAAPDRLASVYGELCDCLTEGRMFCGPG